METAAVDGDPRLLSSSVPQSPQLDAAQLLARAESLPAAAVLAVDVYDPRSVAQLDGRTKSFSQDSAEEDVFNQETVHKRPKFTKTDSYGEQSDLKVERTGEMLIKKNVDMTPLLWKSLLKQGLAKNVSDSPQLWTAESGTEHHADQLPLRQEVVSNLRHKERLSFFNLDGLTMARHSTETSAESRENGAATFPVLLMKHTTLASPAGGWSIILPTSWIHAVWVPLVLAGGHVIGFAERCWLFTYAGLPSFPRDFPDCPAFVDLMAKTSIAYDKKNLRKPPSKTMRPGWSSKLKSFIKGSVENVGKASGNKGTITGLEEGTPKKDWNNSRKEYSSQTGMLTLTMAKEVLSVQPAMPTLEKLRGSKGILSDQKMGEQDCGGGALIDHVSQPQSKQISSGENSHEQDATKLIEKVTSGLQAIENVLDTTLPNKYLPSLWYAPAWRQWSLFVARTRDVLADAISQRNLCHFPFSSVGVQSKGAVRDGLMNGTLAWRALQPSTGVTEKMHDVSSASNTDGRLCFVRVVVRILCRGVLEDDTLLFMPTKQDHDAFLCRSQRWPGVKINEETFRNTILGSNGIRKRKMVKDGSHKKLAAEGGKLCPEGASTVSHLDDAIEEENTKQFSECKSRGLLGFVTSSIPQGRFPGTAFCELVGLTKLRGIQMSDERWWRSEIFVLALSNFSDILRPAVVTICLENCQDIFTV